MSGFYSSHPFRPPEVSLRVFRSTPAPSVVVLAFISLLEHCLLQLGQSPGLLGLHPPVLLSPAVVSRLSDLDRPAEVSASLALGDQLLSGFELADDLLGCVAGSFHGEVPDPVWPDEDSH